MITGLRLQNFRSYDDAAFEFTEGVNIIVGPNASGKTNLLEALLIVCLGESYRASHPEMIALGKTWSRLDGQTPNSSRSVRISAELPIGKSFVIDGTTYKRLVTAKTIPVVVFEPNHLLLLSGAPQLRRSYMDDLLGQIVASYKSTHRAYARTLAQRNRLLKNHERTSKDQIFPWNVRLSELGGTMAAQRQQLLAQLNDKASELYSSLSGRTSQVSMRYCSKLPLGDYASSFLKQLEADLALDIARGFTGTGPHHDDFELLIDDHSAHSMASRGEARTALLMLKVIELRLLEENRGTRPLLLLDDVFSELDGARRQALTRFLQPYQTFITTTDADVVMQHFTSSNVIPTYPRAAAG